MSAAQPQQASGGSNASVEATHIRIVVDVDAAFASAEDAMQKAMTRMAAGADIQDVVPDLARFFLSQGEILIAVLQEESEAGLDKADRKRKKTEEEFISLMRSKRLMQLETDLKELLIYTGNGAVYEEMVKRRAAVVDDFRRGRIEEFKALELERLSLKRKKEKFRRRIEESVTMAFGGALIIAVLAGIFLIVQHAIAVYLS